MTTPPPIPGSTPESLQPIVIPAGSASSGGPVPPVTPPRGAATRSPLLLLAVAIIAVVLLIVNSVGLAGFPGNAPVEMLYALGINVDLFAIALACGIGALISRRRYPLRSSTPIAVIAVVFAGVALAFWVIFGGIGSIVQLFPPDRGRYMYAAGGLFIAGAPWVLATVFGAHGFRRGGERRNNTLAVIALGVAALLALYVVASSVIYGMGLTD